MVDLHNSERISYLVFELFFSPVPLQFGMLIEYLFEKFPNWEDVGNQAIGDLQVSTV